ncbi:hypothetical protein GNP35_01505 [Psychrosphaera haliotis]|uniref:Phospholipase A1 n=2 Tax=Psychrosphaera haliotis TaxID=555083 RepID=A0A6N8F4T3_9GAMM|nr:hypothetical protein [Psychrosphaera haliotis]
MKSLAHTPLTMIIKCPLMCVRNWKTGNGSIELNYSFPFPGSSRLVGFAQYFSGYGESLIDYNHKQQKVGIGIAVNDIF